MIIAEITGSLPAAVGCFAAAIGVGLVGAKAVESVGRNPDASGKILVQSILGMAGALMKRPGSAIFCTVAGSLASASRIGAQKPSMSNSPPS